MAFHLSMGAVIRESVEMQLVHGVFEKVKKYLKRQTNQCMAEASHLPEVLQVSTIYLWSYPAVYSCVWLVVCSFFFFKFGRL